MCTTNISIESIDSFGDFAECIKQTQFWDLVLTRNGLLLSFYSAELSPENSHHAHVLATSHDLSMLGEGPPSPNQPLVTERWSGYMVWLQASC